MQKYSYWNAVKTQYFRNFDWEMMTYWAIVGGYYAFSYSRQGPGPYAPHVTA
jgi:hypothetical protein